MMPYIHTLPQYTNYEHDLLRCLCGSYNKWLDVFATDKQVLINSISVSLDGLKSSTNNNDAHVRASANRKHTCLSRPCAQAPKYHYHIWQDCVSISAFHKTTPGKILLLGLLRTPDCCTGLLVFIRNPFSAPAKTVASTLLRWMKSGMQGKMPATRTQSSTDGRKLNSDCQSHLSHVCIYRSCKYQSCKCRMICSWNIYA